MTEPSADPINNLPLNSTRNLGGFSDTSGDSQLFMLIKPPIVVPTMMPKQVDNPRAKVEFLGDEEEGQIILPKIN